MRSSWLAAASVALLACLGACSSDGDSTSVEAASVAATPTPEPTPVDPFAWTDVEYEDYLEAAKELGLRPDVLVPQAGFSSGLGALCRSSAEELAAMRSAHAEYTQDTDRYATAKYLSDEIGLRLGLACPQRMGDWTEASMERDSETDAENSTVTDEDLARAAEEEANNSGDEPYAHETELTTPQATHAPE
ncbi:hypothetical protein GCM10009547_45220 [Sporichthya brevicatena]|uniref:DUF732 domain-containing protein n=1 Tax=Sporichthya brevicatena TaxID=171442 RepID=A0ABN1HAS8_9ACTN